VADAKNVIGFDPFVNLVDYLEARAGFVPAPSRRARRPHRTSRPRAGAGAAGAA
jgi:hypothetical protein